VAIFVLLCHSDGSCVLDAKSNNVAELFQFILDTFTDGLLFSSHNPEPIIVYSLPSSSQVLLSLLEICVFWSNPYDVNQVTPSQCLGKEPCTQDLSKSMMFGT
jgi:hypothetical protein